MDSVIRDVTESIKATAKELERHLKVNTPVMNSDINGIQEANLTFHFSHQCLLKGWLIYPESSNFTNSNSSKSRERVDLHVIDTDKFILTVEAKKFFDATSGEQIIADFERSENIEYDHQYNHLPHYSLLLAVTEKQGWEDWWLHSQKNYTNSSNTWVNLSQILEGEGMEKSSCVMDDDRKKHYLLYAVKRVR